MTGAHAVTSSCTRFYIFDNCNKYLMNILSRLLLNFILIQTF